MKGLAVKIKNTDDTIYFVNAADYSDDDILLIPVFFTNTLKVYTYEMREQLELVQ